MTSILNRSRDSGRKSPDRRVSFGTIERYDISVSNKLESQLPPSPTRERANWLISTSQVCARVRRALSLAFFPSYGDTVTFGEVRDFLVEYEIVTSASQATEKFVVDTISSLFPSVCVKASAKYSFIFVNLESRVHDVVKEELINVTTEDIEPLETRPDSPGKKGSSAKPSLGMTPVIYEGFESNDHFGSMLDNKVRSSASAFASTANSFDTPPYNKSHELHSVRSINPKLSEDDLSPDKEFKPLGTSEMIVLNPLSANEHGLSIDRQGSAFRDRKLSLTSIDTKVPVSPSRVADENKQDKKGLFHLIKESFSDADAKKQSSPSRGYVSEVNAENRTTKHSDVGLVNGHDSPAPAGRRASQTAFQQVASPDEVGLARDPSKRLVAPHVSSEAELLKNGILYIVNADARRPQCHGLGHQSASFEDVPYAPSSNEGTSLESFQERCIELPRVTYQECAMEALKVNTQERAIDVPKVSTQERAIDVPKASIQERAIDVPKVSNHVDRSPSQEVLASEKKKGKGHGHPPTRNSSDGRSTSPKSEEDASSFIPLRRESSFLSALNNFWDESSPKNDDSVNYSNQEFLTSSGTSLKRSKSMQFSKRLISTDQFTRTGSLSERRGVAKNYKAAPPNHLKSLPETSAWKEQTDGTKVLSEQTAKQAAENCSKNEKLESSGQSAFPQAKPGASGFSRPARGESSVRSSFRANSSGSAAAIAGHTNYEISSGRGSVRDPNRVEPGFSRNDDLRSSIRNNSSHHLANRPTASSKAKMVSQAAQASAQKKSMPVSRESVKQNSKPSRDKQQEKDFSKISGIFSEQCTSEVRCANPKVNHVNGGLPGSHDANGSSHLRLRSDRRYFKTEDLTDDSAEFIELFLRDVIENDFHEVAGAKTEVKFIFKHIRKRGLEIERSGGFTQKVDLSKLEISHYFDVFFELLGSMFDHVGCELSIDKAKKEKELYLLHVEFKKDVYNSESNNRIGTKHANVFNNKKRQHDIDESVVQSLV